MNCVTSLVSLPLVVFRRVVVEWVEESSSLLFQHREYHGYVTENTTKPMTVTVVSVLGGELNQHIRFLVANPSPLFLLGPTSGALVTTGVPFDRESQDRYTVYVQVQAILEYLSHFRMTKMIIRVQ